MTIAPAMVVERTDRGDDMFMAVFGRAAQMAEDRHEHVVAAIRPLDHHRRGDRHHQEQEALAPVLLPALLP